MKKRKFKRRLARPKIKLCRGIIFYLLLLLFALIFTQALLSPVSAVTYVFVLALPTADIICLIISYLSVSARSSAERAVTEKNSVSVISFDIINKGLIPIPCIDISVSLPDGKTAKSLSVPISVSVGAFSKVNASIPISVPFRGVYLVGASELYIYDLFRLVGIKKKISAAVKVNVVPSFLPSCGAFSLSSIPANEAPRRGISQTGDELGDIRQYLPGDSFKSIHWKLSTKTEELQTRKYMPSEFKTLSVFCDFGGSYGKYLFNDEAVLFAADRIAEEALSAAGEAAYETHISSNVVFRPANFANDILSFDISGSGSLSSIALCLSEAEIYGIPSGISGIENKLGNSVVFVTAYRSDETEAYIKEAAATLGTENVSVCLCGLSETVSEHEKEDYISALRGCVKRLSEAGIKVTVPTRNGGGTA